MAYRLEALLGSDDVLRPLAASRAEASLVPLRCGVSMIPLTDKLSDAISDARLDEGKDGPFWKFPGGGEDLLLAWSRRGPIAYVEVNLFGAGTARGRRPRAFS